MSAFTVLEHLNLNGTEVSTLQFSTPVNGFYLEARHNLTSADVNIDVSRTKLYYAGTIAGELAELEETVLDDWKPANGEITSIGANGASILWTVTFSTTVPGNIGVAVWTD